MGSRSLKIVCFGLAGLVAVATQVVAYEAVEVKDGGIISGTVTFVGTPPPRQRVKVDQDLLPHRLRICPFVLAGSSSETPYHATPGAGGSDAVRLAHPNRCLEIA